MYNFGKEAIIDLHDCDASKFNRENIEKYLVNLCDLIDMQRADLHFWDYDGIPEEERDTEAHLLGTSAIQFIQTSNITIHTLEIPKSVYLNIFSCKDFDAEVTKKFSEDYFEGKTVNFHVMPRI